MILVFSNSNGFYGGVQVLSDRFGSYLEEKGIPFVFFDGPDTKLDQKWKNKLISNERDLIALSSSISHVFFPSFVSIRTFEKYYDYFPHAKISGLVVHPNEPYISFYPLSLKALYLFGYRSIKYIQYILYQHTKKVSGLFCEAADKEAIFLMDGATKRALNYFYPDLKKTPQIIPIPSPVYPYIKGKPLDKDTTNVGYLGRVDYLKMSALRSFISQYSSIEKFNLHLIGGGDKMNELRKFCYNLGVNLVEYGFRPNDEARTILIENTNFSIAMGTSALDIASTGLPCVIIDPSLNQRAPTQNRFRFVHEIEDYTLGEYRDSKLYVGGSNSIEDIYNIIKNDKDIGIAGRDYVKLHHDPEKSFSALLEGIMNSKFTGENAGKLIKDINSSFRAIKFYKRGI